MSKKIGFFGPAGTYTEEAAMRYNPTATLHDFPTITAVGKAVATGIVDEGVAPIENSVEGSVSQTLDLLIHDDRGVSIVGELVLPINHYMMVNPGIPRAAVIRIYSHSQSLAQCADFLDKHYPKVEQIVSPSNSQAVLDMQNSNVPAAAIAPKRAADIYGAEIIYSAIQDRGNNETRFVVLARYNHPPTGEDKTSICFSFDRDAPSLLYHALGEFALRGINLYKVESRPTKEVLGRYIFLVDCEGHCTDTVVVEALQGLELRVSMLKILGSYPRWQNGKG